MNLLSYLLPHPTDLELQSWSFDATTQQVIFNVTSTQAVAHCPLCQIASHRVHSRYERTLKDLPLAQFALTLVLSVCKFFCSNNTCARRVFSERLPRVVAPWARRTARYGAHLRAMGLALGGAAAARLSVQVGYGHSRNTFLHLLSGLRLPEVSAPKQLGVDDFALRKGHQYGTILVNLDTHAPVALLPDRSAETLATWLREHPGTEVLSRDRSKAYRQGMNQGAPEAVQVADRFHLLHNLEETLEKILKENTPVLRRLEQAHLDETVALHEPSPRESASELSRQQQKAQKRSQRLERYERVHALRDQGYRIRDIAHHLGMGERTVYTYLSHETFPEWQPSVFRHPRRSRLDPYKLYLCDQWQQGRQQIRHLFEEIQQQGYSGSYATVARYTQRIRGVHPSITPVPESLNDLPGRGPAPKTPIEPPKPLSAQRAAWLVLQRPETLDDDQRNVLQRLSRAPELSEAVRLTQGFIDLVRQRLPHGLDRWLKEAKDSSIKLFQSFAKGIEGDYDAVKAGLTLEVSNGPVEGQNNRLKMLKRQMFGRAGLKLLEKRLILSSQSGFG